MVERKYVVRDKEFTVELKCVQLLYSGQKKVRVHVVNDPSDPDPETFIDPKYNDKCIVIDKKETQQSIDKQVIDTVEGMFKEKEYMEANFYEN